MTDKCEIEEQCNIPEDIISNRQEPNIKSPILLPYQPLQPTTVTTIENVSGSISSSPPNEEESDSDDELKRITESNRHIPCSKSSKTASKEPKTVRNLSVAARKELLVFSSNPTIIKKSDRIIIHNHYGAGPQGQLSPELAPKRKSRSYLVACDFSDESFHAIEWTMGTMMRDGDKLHIITAVNKEDQPETTSLTKELKKASDTVTEESKKTLGQMLLFDIELVTYAICGRAKDVLFSLIEELPLTMVVCGSRGRGTVKGILMGSISTFLVHKSPVPVTVIRPQKKKATTQKRSARAPPLSKSIQSGELTIDKSSSKETTNDTAVPPAIHMKH